MRLLKLSLFVAYAILCSCGSSTSNSISAHEQFASRPDYKKTYDTYTDSEALKNVDRNQTSIRVSVKNQRMLLKQGDTVLIDTPCTTGRSGKRTPYGTFKLHDRQTNKRSNVYGMIYRNGKCVCRGHRHEKCRRYKGRYVGASLPYWQRLTSSGIGMHASKGVKRYPASGGCIRLKPAYAKSIFYKTKTGTPITIAD